MMVKCKNADRYRAMHPPRCNKGNPCQVCRLKWENAELRRYIERERERADPCCSY
jgi:hypothetical protein